MGVSVFVYSLQANMYNARPHPRCSSYSRLYEPSDFVLNLLI